MTEVLKEWRVSLCNRNSWVPFNIQNDVLHVQNDKTGKHGRGYSVANGLDTCSSCYSFWRLTFVKMYDQLSLILHFWRYTREMIAKISWLRKRMSHGRDQFENVDAWSARAQVNSRGRSIAKKCCIRPPQGRELCMERSGHDVPFW